MSNIEFLTIPVTGIFIILAIFWLIPKEFYIELATAKYFSDLIRFNIMTPYLLESVKNFKEDFERNYYKDLVISSIIITIIILLLSGLIYWAIFG